MLRTASTDRLTVVAVAVMAYAAANVCHEIVGHCGMAALVGTRCTVISSTYIPLAEMPPRWKYNVIVVAGSASNWAVGLSCLGLLRALRPSAPTPRYLLWLTMCANLFLASSYVAAAPLIRYGDSYILIRELPGQLFWRGAVALTGGVILWLCFRVCGAELGRLLGFGGRAAREVAWRLVVPAYVAGGVVTVASGLLGRLGELDFKLMLLQTAGGTFGLTVWLLLLPLRVPEPPEPAGRPFEVRRSAGWIAAGALVGLTFVGVLGPGIPL